jgi:short-subunit dehydrogenase
MTIVITGATKGIGRAIAELFAAKGFNLGLCARTATDLEQFKTELAALYPMQTFFTYAADLAKTEEVKQFATAVLSVFPTIDILVNNTGVFMPGAISEEADGNLEQMIETNLYSAYHLTRALLPTMLSRQSGHIFMMCSIASTTAYPNGGSYSISKFALLGLSKVLREELKPKGIRVTALLPGATLTNSWAGTDLPAARFMKSEDVAQTVWAAYELSEHTVIEEIVLRPQLGDI